jgi:hypothetical protein
VPTPATELRLKGLEHKVCARGFRWMNRRQRNSDFSDSCTSNNSYVDRREHGRISFRNMESDEFNLEHCVPSKIYERPAESGRRNR